VHIRFTLVSPKKCIDFAICRNTAIRRGKEKPDFLNSLLRHVNTFLGKESRSRRHVAGTWDQTRPYVADMGDQNRRHVTYIGEDQNRRHVANTEYRYRRHVANIADQKRDQVKHVDDLEGDVHYIALRYVDLMLNRRVEEQQLEHLEEEQGDHLEEEQVEQVEEEQLEKEQLEELEEQLRNIHKEMTQLGEVIGVSIVAYKHILARSCLGISKGLQYIIKLHNKMHFR
jgi:hypothetical protein